MSKEKLFIPKNEGIPATDYLEVMAGANKWHQVARQVFIESFMNEKHEGNLSLVTNRELAERLLHEGKFILENGQEGRGGFSKIAEELYKIFELEVQEIGDGDVAEYAKKKSGKSRKELWGF